MKKRPLILWFLSGIHLIIAMSMILQVNFQYGFSLLELHRSWFYLTYLNKALIFSSILMSIISYNGSFLLWPAIVINTGLVLWNNYLVATWSMNVSSGVPLWASLGYILLSLSTVSETMRMILLKPDLRWWLNKRLRLKLAVTLKQYHQTCKVKTFDISRSGAFLEHSSPQNLGIDQSNPLQLTLSPAFIRPFRVDARLIRFADQKQGDYPAGLGIKFVNLDLLDRLRLRLLCGLS